MSLQKWMFYIDQEQKIQIIAWKAVRFHTSVFKQFIFKDPDPKYNN